MKKYHKYYNNKEKFPYIFHDLSLRNGDDIRIAKSLHFNKSDTNHVKSTLVIKIHKTCCQHISTPLNFTTVLRWNCKLKLEFHSNDIQMTYQAMTHSHKCQVLRLLYVEMLSE